VSPKCAASLAVDYGWEEGLPWEAIARRGIASGKELTVQIVVPHGTRRTARVAIVTASLLVAAGGVAPVAFAKQSGLGPPPPPPPITTQTGLTASPGTVATDRSVKITATVSPGIVVTPSGSVIFTDTTTGTRLGTVKPGRRCLLVKGPCAVRISVRGSRLAPGPNTITGAYSGDIVELPSSGSVIVTRSDSNPTVVTTCPAGSPFCITNTDTSVDGTADALIATYETTQATETLSVSFQTTELPCSTPDTGDPVVFSSTNAPSEKYVTYDVYGTAADIANEAYGTAGNICYESPELFITKDYRPPILGPDGEYYGLLPSCAQVGDAPPCIESASFQEGGQPDGPSEDEYTENVIVTAADPRISN
jgi:hypothetical protein